MSGRRQVLATAAAALGVAALTAGCGSRAATPAVQYARYQYSCCQNGLPTVAHPGQDILLRWTASAEAPTTSTGTTAVTLSASVTGPFPTVTALKTAMSATKPPAPAARAVDVRTTDRAGGTPVSTVALPALAPPGFYDVRTAVVSGGGMSSGDAIVQVVTAGPGATPTS